MSKRGWRKSSWTFRVFWRSSLPYFARVPLFWAPKNALVFPLQDEIISAHFIALGNGGYEIVLGFIWAAWFLRIRPSSILINSSLHRVTWPFLGKSISIFESLFLVAFQKWHFVHRKKISTFLDVKFFFRFFPPLSSLQPNGNSVTFPSQHTLCSISSTLRIEYI